MKELGKLKELRRIQIPEFLEFLQTSMPAVASYCSLLTPPRATRRELLDEPIADRAALAANLADIRTVNRRFGGSARVIKAVAEHVGGGRTLGVASQLREGRGGSFLGRGCSGLTRIRRDRSLQIRVNPCESASRTIQPHNSCQLGAPGAVPLRLLDVATGSADVPLALMGWASQQGLPLQIYASDVQRDVLAEARRYTGGALPLLCHNALHLPYPDNSFDIITCAQALHHFAPPEAVTLLRELARVARVAVIISDLNRSWPAYWGARLLGIVQRSQISRHDGPLSVLRAYTPIEARALLGQAGLRGHVRNDGLLRWMMIITIKEEQ